MIKVDVEKHGVFQFIFYTLLNTGKLRQVWHDDCMSGPQQIHIETKDGQKIVVEVRREGK